MKNITLFSGSNNPQSINQKLVVMLSEMISETKNTIIELRDYDMPMYSLDTQNSSGAPLHALQLKKELDNADLLIISVPEYNGSMPSFFKNVLDWLSRSTADYKVFGNKPILLLSASPGGGGHTTLSHAETVLSRLGGIVKGKIVVNNFFKKTALHENKFQLIDDTILKEIHEILNTIHT